MSPFCYLGVLKIYITETFTMRNLFFAILLVFPTCLFSQDFDWLKTVGDINHDFGQWVETDDSGNIYVAGMGQGSCNFDTHNITSLDPFWFVAKYDSNGINAWVTQIPFNNGYNFEMRDFKVTKSGQTYIVGDVNTNGGLYAMLVKVDSAGNLVKQITPPGTQNIYSITFDSNDNYYIGGVGYSGSTTVMFINRYSANDNFSWRANFENAVGLYNNLSMRVTPDDGLLFSFIFKSTLTVTDHSTGSITLNATQGILDSDRAIAKYDANGVLLWAKNYDDNMPGRQITVDTANNNFYLLAHDADGNDADYLLLFNPLGNPVWSKNINDQGALLAWEPKIRLRGDHLFFIGGGISYAASSSSWGDFAFKWFDLSGNLSGQFAMPQGVYPILGDIAFHGNTAYLVGCLRNGTWGNQTITTVHGTSYDDYFLGALNENNFITSTSITSVPSKISLSFFPNPVKDYLFITLSNAQVNGEIILRDINGRTVTRQKITNPNESLNLTQFPSGIYILSYNGMDGINMSRIVKE